MLEILDAVERWHAEGLDVALATVVSVERSAPRAPGAMMVVNARGDVAGSVSGGCIESAVYQEAQDTLAGGRPRLETYGISDAEAISVGLTCGGTIAVFIERLNPSSFERLATAIRMDRPVARATRLDGAQLGTDLLVLDDAIDGDLGSPGLTHAAAHEVRALLRAGKNALRTFGFDGEPVGMDVRVFVHAFAPKPDMFIFGANDFSRAVARIGRYLGYTVSVIDARSIFATPERMPDADRVIVAWPDAFLAVAPVDERTALIVLTHDVKFDLPLLRVALRTRAGYIGAMGSRTTHANRLADLHRSGVSEAEIARISGPIGLDIGARTPEETAISIAAEIIAVREARSGGRLRDTTQPVHNARAEPVTAN